MLPMLCRPLSALEEEAYAVHCWIVVQTPSVAHTMGCTLCLQPTRCCTHHAHKCVFRASIVPIQHRPHPPRTPLCGEHQPPTLRGGAPHTQNSSPILPALSHSAIPSQWRLLQVRPIALGVGALITCCIVLHQVVPTCHSPTCSPTSAAWCWVVLRGAAWCCLVLRGVVLP